MSIRQIHPHPASAIAGLDNTGATDMTSAINTKLAAASDGEVLLFPPGRYRIDSQISWANKALHLRALGRVVFVEGAPFTTPMILCTDGDGSSIEGITIEGLETAGTFDGADSNRDGIRFSSVDQGRISDVTITGKSIGIRLETCTRTKVLFPTITGFAISAIAGINNHSGVRIRGGSHCAVVNIDAKNIGSAVLGQSDGTSAPQRLSIDGGCVEGCWDNGIYASSGDYWDISGFHAYNGVTGIKVRGNQHRVRGCTLDTMTIGIHATGNGTSIDSQGANGVGTIIAGNVIRNTTQDGIYCADQDGFYPRDFQIEHNTLRMTATGGGGSAAIRASGHGMKVRHNYIDGAGGTTAQVVIVGAAADPWIDLIENCDVSHNVLNQPTVDGFRLGQMTKSTIAFNRRRGVDGSDVIDARTVTNSTFAHNEGPGQGRVVRLDAASTGNRLINNNGSITSATSCYVEHADAGTPEGAVSAAVGSLWRRTDGGAATTMYVKESGTGNIGWVAK